MFPIQELPTNEHKAVVISQLFGIALPTRYEDKQWRKLVIKLTQYGYYDIETHTDINYQTHEAYIKRYQASYGFDFDRYVRQENKQQVKQLVKELFEQSDADFNQLAYNNNLMTTLEKKCFESNSEHKKRYGDQPIESHQKHSIDDLLQGK